MNCKSVIYETGKKDQTKLNTQKSAGRRQKKKSRRTADISSRAIETAALIFRAAVFFAFTQTNDD